MRRCSTRRMLAGALAFGLATLAGAGAAAAQALGFWSLGAAEAAAARIMEASGLRADFEIVVDTGIEQGLAGGRRARGRGRRRRGGLDDGVESRRGPARAMRPAATRR